MTFQRVDNGAWPGWGGPGFLAEAIILGLLIWAVVALLTRLADAGHGSIWRQHHVTKAEEVLAERFARGEIDADEYAYRLEIIMGERGDDFL